jgi:hypothetical protein
MPDTTPESNARRAGAPGFLAGIWIDFRPYLRCFIIDALICGILLLMLFFFREVARYMGAREGDLSFATSMGLICIAGFFGAFFVINVFRIMDD